MRLSLSATAAAAVLYGAVVVFGLGPASPSAIGSSRDHSAPVVRLARGPAVPGPVRRLPQVSAGPARHRPKLQPQAHTSAPVTKAAASALSQHAPRPTGTEPKQQPPTVPRKPEGGPAAPPPPLSIQSATPLPLPLPLPLPDVTVPLPGLPDGQTLPQLPALPSAPPLPALP